MILDKVEKNSVCKIKAVPQNDLLYSLGIMVGRKVIVKNKYPLSGPVVVQVNRRDVAIGRVIAKDIIVEVQ